RHSRRRAERLGKAAGGSSHCDRRPGAMAAWGHEYLCSGSGRESPGARHAGFVADLLIRTRPVAQPATSRFFVRAPRQYRMRPRKIDVRVPPTSLSSKLHLSLVSPGGTSETKIPTRITRKPRTPLIHRPSFPPGTKTAWGFSVRSLRQ